jgi:hypothetical protein
MDIFRKGKYSGEGLPVPRLMTSPLSSAPAAFRAAAPRDLASRFRRCSKDLARGFWEHLGLLNISEVVIGAIVPASGSDLCLCAGISENDSMEGIADVIEDIQF